MLQEWKDSGCDETELTRCLIDLFFVSVLLDAGAGDHWRYVEPQSNKKYERSEGIAVASLYMFKALAFSAGKSTKVPVVDGERFCVRAKHRSWLLTLFLGAGLEKLSTKTLAEGFQITENNPMLGVEARANLLRSLGSSLLAHPDVFGTEGRPGNVVGRITCLGTEPVELTGNRRLSAEDSRRCLNTRYIKILGYPTNAPHPNLAKGSHSCQWLRDRRCMAPQHVAHASTLEHHRYD